jgi:hypothetical protein
VAELHRSSAYLVRRAALASSSVTSGALDGLSRRYPVLPDNERSQAHIPGPDQVSMERVMAVLANKEQPVLRAVLPAGMATAGAALAGVVRIHRDTDAASQRCFIGEESAEFGKCPPRGVVVGPSLLFACPLALLSFGALANASQLFQTKKDVGMGVQDLFGDGVINAQRSPVSSACCMAMRRRVALRVPWRWSLFCKRA